MTSYDLRFGQGRLHDRYLFYVVPLVLIGFVAMLRDWRWSRWSLFASAGVLAMSFSVVPVIRYQKFNVDSPVAVLNDGLLDLGGSVHGAQLFLAFATIVVALLFLLASVFLRKRQVVILLLATAALAIPVQTGLAFNRLLTVDGTSGRPLTVDQGVVFDWIDRNRATRFRIAGEVLGEDRGVALIRAAKPWRAEWLAFDLYRDGWTVPKVVGTIRVFAAPGQSSALRRFLTVSVRGPQDVAARSFHVVSNASDWRGEADEHGTSNQISVCVPAGGYADVKVSTTRYSPIYGDPRSESSFVSYARSGGVLVTGIALADETGFC